MVHRGTRPVVQGHQVVRPQEHIQFVVPDGDLAAHIEREFANDAVHVVVPFINSRDVLLLEGIGDGKGMKREEAAQDCVCLLTAARDVEPHHRLAVRKRRRPFLPLDVLLSRPFLRDIQKACHGIPLRVWAQLSPGRIRRPAGHGEVVVAFWAAWKSWLC